MSTLALFPKPGRRRQRVPGTVLHIEVGRRTAWLYGAHVKALINAVDAPSQWDPARRTWMVSITRADDVIAWAEHRERRVVTVKPVQR